VAVQVDPISSPQTWDVVIIANVTSPFVCKVNGFKRSHDWDVKKGKGSLGATITFVGRSPAKGSIEFFATQPAHFTAWNTFLPLLKYDPTKKSVKPVDIYHPSLADVDINSVVTENVGAWEHKGQQLYSRVVDFLEYFPPPPQSAVSTPTGAIATSPGQVPGSAPPSADDALQAQIAQLMKKAAAP
jgi:hypothetical protein